MADLNNLLAELDEAEAIMDEEEQKDDSSSDKNEDEKQQQMESTTTEYNDDEEPKIPPILAAAKLSSETAPTMNTDDDDDDNEDDNNGEDEEDGVFTLDEDYKRLRSIWIREYLSPELMPNNFASEISLELELLSGQEETLEKYALQKSTNTKNHNEISLLEDITKLDSARVKFVLEDLLTTRLNKIEDYALHNRELVDRMSEEEVHHLKSYGELLERHFNRTVLDHMPKDAWKKLDEPDMIDSPDLNQFVFCRVLDQDGVQISNSNNSMEDEDDAMNIQQHDYGACLIVRYGAIQTLLLEEKVELLM